MTAKEMQREAASYLSRYQVAKAEVSDIEKRIERVRSEMMGVKGISYENGDMPKAQFRTLNRYMDAFLLEYTRNAAVKKKIQDYCKASGAGYYISSNVDL